MVLGMWPDMEHQLRKIPLEPWRRRNCYRIVWYGSLTLRGQWLWLAPFSNYWIGKNILNGRCGLITMAPAIYFYKFQQYNKLLTSNYFWLINVQQFQHTINIVSNDYTFCSTRTSKIFQQVQNPISKIVGYASVRHFLYLRSVPPSVVVLSGRMQAYDIWFTGVSV